MKKRDVLQSNVTLSYMFAKKYAVTMSGKIKHFLRKTLNLFALSRQDIISFV